MRYGAILACLAMATFATAVAQMGNDDPAEAAVEDVAAEETPEDAVAEPDPGGDIIKLKSGAELRGLQVLRETPTLYIVEIFEGVPPLEVPRRQVIEIVYDEIDPTRMRRSGELAPEAEPTDELLGTNIDPELLRDKAFTDKLIADVCDPESPIKGLPLPQALKKLSERIDLPIVPSAGVKKRNLVWKTDLQPGTSLVSALGEDFQKEFPGLVVIYKKKGINVFTKQEINALQKAQEASANS